MTRYLFCYDSLPFNNSGFTCYCIIEKPLLVIIGSQYVIHL